MARPSALGGRASVRYRSRLFAVPAAFANAMAVLAKSLFLAEWPNSRRGQQSAHIEPLLGKALFHGGATCRVHTRRSGEDPQVLAVRLRHRNELVVRLEIDDPVVAPDPRPP